jgi:quercetin dioxygenase-like cupin family protein
MRIPRARRASSQALVVTTAAATFVALGVGLGIAATSVTRDTTDVRLRVLQSSFEDGFDSGWHTHPGPVIVQVSQGYFKFYQGSCQPVVVHAGETFFEVPFVPIRAVAVGPITWTTSQIIPNADAPLTVVSDPCG